MADPSQTATRRTVLAATGGAVLLALATSGCTSDTATATISPDQAALDAALVGEDALAASFEAGVIGSNREQRRGQSAARTHRAHATELNRAGARTTVTPTATPVPREARELARRQRAQADRLEQLALGVSPRVALLLGSIAASNAATAALLGQGR